MDPKFLTNKSYKVIEIWKRLDDKTAKRYLCFEILGEKKFGVQNVDFFYYPIDENQLKNAEKQKIELLIDIEPIERTEFYSSLEIAIDKHDAEFR